jgi:phenylalanyl-tRNA synthetase beta chain
MKVSWKWLGKFVDLEGIDPVKTGERFTISVAEIDEVIKVGEGLEDLVIAKVLELEEHPDSDKLQLALVDLGGEKIKVVCGASNVKVGMLTAFAGIGAKVLDKNGEFFEITKIKIRGVESTGMLVSSYEMGLGDDHSGIIEFHENFKPGTKLVEISPLKDVIWDIDNKSLTHRPDLWGHRGLAREVAALVERPFKGDIEVPEFTSHDPLHVEIQNNILCPRYSVYQMSGIKIQSAPFWMQVFLYHADQRPISNIVDFTNYVMLTVGNPLHAFDKREIQDSTILIRNAFENEKMKTLDGEKHELKTSDLLIADKTRGVALAGIMGGENSEVADDTTDILLESANFEPGNLRRTATSLGIRTESSVRFEKSLDPKSCELAAYMFANIVLENIEGSHISSKFYDEGTHKDKNIKIDLSGDFIRKLLGTPVSNERILKILSALDFKVNLENDDFSVKVPSYRATKDISQPEDIVEEVGRIYGYGNITPVAPRVLMEKPWILPIKNVEKNIKDTMSLQLGFHQVMNYSFDKEANIEKAGLDISKAIKLKNPISKEEPVLKTSLVLNLLDMVLKNERRENSIKIYEIGRVFHKNSPGKIPLQPKHLGIIIGDKKLSEDPDGKLFYQMKYVVEKIFDRVGRGLVEFKSVEVEKPWIHPSRSSSIYLNGKSIGYFSSLNPILCKKMDISSGVSLAIINLDEVANLEKVVTLFNPLPKFPAIKHDISIIVEKTVKSSQVIDLIKSIDSELIKEIRCVDVYSGEKFPGKRSLSFRLTFSHAERTLKQKEITNIHKVIVKTIKDSIGGTIME